MKWKIKVISKWKGSKFAEPEEKKKLFDAPANRRDMLIKLLIEYQRRDRRLLKVIIR